MALVSAAAIDDQNVYLDVETAFDPWSLGLANCGSTIDIVTSDGLSRCLRMLIASGATATGPVRTFGGSG